MIYSHPFGGNIDSFKYRMCGDNGICMADNPLNSENRPFEILRATKVPSYGVNPGLAVPERIENQVETPGTGASLHLTGKDGRIGEKVSNLVVMEKHFF
jgi:hypothetical protein